MLPTLACSYVSNVLTEEEWEVVESEIDDNTRLRSFRRHWCLKESYVKARGDGLAFALARAEVPSLAHVGSKVHLVVPPLLLCSVPSVFRAQAAEWSPSQLQ